MNISWLKIANTALSKINYKILQNLDEANTPALLCREHLPIVTSQIIQMNDWKCARKRAQLPSMVEVPDFGYAHQFLLPSDFARIYSLDVDVWEREGNKLLSDASVLNLIYIAIPELPESLDPLIISAIVSMLASNLVFALTGDGTKSSFFYQEASAFISMAKNYEGAGEKDVMPNYNDWGVMV